MYSETAAVAYCDVCKGEIYANELVHVIDGFVVCPDWFYDFVFDYFSENLVLAGEYFGKQHL